MEKVIIIGGGPAGLSAAIYASRAMLKPLVIEGSLAGGQLTQTTEVENYPGFPNGITGPQLVSDMRAQAERFGSRFITKDVKSVEKINSHFVVTLENDEQVESQTVLVGTGANAKWLGIESEERLKNRGVSACATCDGFFFKDKVVAIVGGGDTAMEEATFLTKFAEKVILIHRRDSFKASKIMQKRVMDNPKIEIMYNHQVLEVLGDTAVTGIKLQNTQTQEESSIEVDGLFIAIGHAPSTSFLVSSGVHLDGAGYIITAERALFDGTKDKADYSTNYKYQTNIEGLFAAGDCVDYSYRQAATAVGMAVAAEIELERYLEGLE